MIRPHKFEAVPGPERTALNRRCKLCKMGPGHSVHLLTLPVVEAEIVAELDAAAAIRRAEEMAPEMREPMEGGRLEGSPLFRHSAANPQGSLF